MFQPSEHSDLVQRAGIVGRLIAFQMKVLMALLDAHPEIKEREDIAAELQTFRDDATALDGSQAGFD